jgi:Ca2+-binding RTX toxin-like protein
MGRGQYKPSGRPTQTNGNDLDFEAPPKTRPSREVNTLDQGNSVSFSVSGLLQDAQGNPIPSGNNNGQNYRVTSLQDLGVIGSTAGISSVKVVGLDGGGKPDNLQVTLSLSPSSSQSTASINLTGSDNPLVAEEVDNGANIHFSQDSIAYRSYGGIPLLEGGDQSDFLYGSAGAETLDGKLSRDYMNGGGGNDTYIVDDVDDYIDESPDTGTETVKASISWNLSQRRFGSDASATGLDNLTLLESPEAINATGNYVSNVIQGNSNDNTIQGFEAVAPYQRQADRYGYRETRNVEQKDTLTGGGGQDTFVLGDTSGSFYLEKGDKDYAEIQDFTLRGFNFNEIDMIQLHGSSSAYRLGSAQGVAGFGANDTAIFYTGGGQNDLIGIVKNSTIRDFSMGFSFVPAA